MGQNEKKIYTPLAISVLSFSADAICASEVGTSWKNTWNGLGDNGYSAGQ